MTLGHDDLTDGHTLTGKEVEVPPVLHHPARTGELTINQDPRTLFSGETLLVGRAFFPLAAMASHYRGGGPLRLAFVSWGVTVTLGSRTMVGPGP